MRLDTLEAFMYVAESGSFKSAAKELDLSQPGISKRIASLELDLSTRLFDRVGRDAYLTEAGQLLLPAAYRINALMMTVQSELASKERKAKGRLSIGISEYVEQDRIASVLKGLCSTTPNSVGEEKIQNLCSIEMWCEKLRVVVEHGHDLAESRKVSFSDLCNYPSVLPKYPTTLRNNIKRELMKYTTNP